MACRRLSGSIYIPPEEDRIQFPNILQIKPSGSCVKVYRARWLRRLSSCSVLGSVIGSASRQAGDCLSCVGSVACTVSEGVLLGLLAGYSGYEKALGSQHPKTPLVCTIYDEYSSYQVRRLCR